MKKFLMFLFAVAFVFVGLNNVSAATNMADATYEFAITGDTENTYEDSRRIITYDLVISGATFDSTKMYYVAFSHDTSTPGNYVSANINGSGNLVVPGTGNTIKGIIETAGNIYVWVKEGEEVIASAKQVARYELLPNRRFVTSFTYDQTEVVPKFSGTSNYSGRSYNYKIGKITDMTIIEAIRTATTRAQKQAAYERLYAYAQAATGQYTGNKNFGTQESITRYMLDLEDGAYYYALLEYDGGNGTYQPISGVGLYQALNCALGEPSFNNPDQPDYFHWPCTQKGDTYYGPNGNVITQSEYIAQCTNPTPICEVKDGHYYDINGNEVTVDEYHASCDPKPTCEMKDGKYYDKDGNQVTEDEYRISCAPKCEIKDGKYYDKDGNQVTEDEYHTSCDPKPSCEIKNDKYYDKDGNEITKEEYEKVCPLPDNPDTGVNFGLGIAFVLVVLGTGVYAVVRKKNRFPQA